ncbi:MAG: tetratricopeptide repeat protein, partial [Calditrichia bacterium]
DNSLVQYNLGVIHYMDKNIRAAEKFFRRAIEIDDYLDAHLYLGAIYMERGDYETALKEFRYRVAHKKGDDDPYALEAMKGIRKCLEELNLMPPRESK